MYHWAAVMYGSGLGGNVQVQVACCIEAPTARNWCAVSDETISTPVCLLCTKPPIDARKQGFANNGQRNGIGQTEAQRSWCQRRI